VGGLLTQPAATDVSEGRCFVLAQLSVDGSQADEAPTMLSRARSGQQARYVVAKELGIVQRSKIILQRRETIDDDRNSADWLAQRLEEVAKSLGRNSCLMRLGAMALA
jgi:hypothetical protein